ncbi:MAG TPA: hypothetical protein VH092_21485 [Urbifossiella sp.]|nr:hypothetical protein [Urbifossiella sp.]
MRGKALAAAGLAAAVMAVVGCHHDKYGLGFKPKEEIVLPPNEARFDNPPSAPYKKRPVKGDEKTLIGRDKSPNGGGPLNPGY